MKLNKVVADKLNYYMGDKWSSYRLSRKTGLAPNTIQGMINCKYEDIKLSSLILLADAFGLTISEFLDDEKSKLENLEFDKF